MSPFLDALHSGRALLMDGPMGTELQRAGLKEGERGEIWNLTHPERVRAVHQAYVDAGAECLLTNTFQANPTALAALGRERDLEAIANAGVTLAREAAGAHRFVLFDVGPLGLGKADPLGTAERLVRVASAAAVDAILLETCSEHVDLLHMLVRRRAALGSAESTLPVLISWTFLRDPHGSVRTVKGMPPRRCVARGYALTKGPARSITDSLDVPRVAAVGVNCGRDMGMDEILKVVRAYRSATDLPLFARPNAGAPAPAGDHWVYPLTPDDMARRLPDLLDAGASMIGGCCGTTPAHIAALRPVLDHWNSGQ